MQIVECLIMSVSPEVIHDVGVKVLSWFFLLLSIVLFFVFTKLYVEHDDEHESYDYDIDPKRSFYSRMMFICVIVIMLTLMKLFL